MFDQGLRVKQDEAEATTEFLFRIYDCTVDSDVGTGNFSLMLGISLICGHTHVRSHVPPAMDKKCTLRAGALQA